ncbi:MAG: 50S ribosomal protein L3 [Patescibacteria group bacterium]
MMTAMLGIKGLQTQTFTQDGMRIPVTVILTGPNYITKIDDSAMGKSIQLGIGTIKNISKAEIGHLKKAGLDKKLRFLRSFPISNVSDISDVSLGQEIKPGDVFAVGDTIRVTGTSKGKGFASAIKRHGFKGGPRTHGQSDRERAPGSIGSTTTPGRVFKGKRMAGRMGSDRVTVRNLTIVGIDLEKHTITVKGLVPGSKNGLLIIAKESVKKISTKH